MYYGLEHLGRWECIGPYLDLGFVVEVVVLLRQSLYVALAVLKLRMYTTRLASQSQSSTPHLCLPSQAWLSFFD